MARIIRNSRVEDDAWTLLPKIDAAADAAQTPPAGPLLLPLDVWLAQREQLLARGEALGVWLDAADDPAAIAADLEHFTLLAVNFPKFTDGRGYSIARTLRERYGYRGELRAIGDVLHDQLYLLRRCGFDAFALRADKDAERALAGLTAFSDSYQGAVEQPLPLFRRRPAQPGEAV
ncbi:DUF934 domain-containing protein [Rhodocyclus tenuis]|uniref:Uncharacterized protein (DUF934 family) n=1 Tax=Rhodocyclus tenuis TaxID=1066 RepID=A0A840G6V9_RHOTE|nr:DUF934 domain-containing protein [Rhodocyclus tenuis]MBB4247606.1 uncharacterized protein (DUF934 family) [Rhodocyclus tenuis]